jgi:hypothetical protein
MTKRGERMRKLLVLMLVLGFLVGTLSLGEILCENDISIQNIGLTVEEGFGENCDLAPCGGEGTGGGAVPG